MYLERDSRLSSISSFVIALGIVLLSLNVDAQVMDSLQIQEFASDSTTAHISTNSTAKSRAQEYLIPSGLIVLAGIVTLFLYNARSK